MYDQESTQINGKLKKKKKTETLPEEIGDLRSKNEHTKKKNLKWVEITHERLTLAAEDLERLATRFWRTRKKSVKQHAVFPQ